MGEEEDTSFLSEEDLEHRGESGAGVLPFRTAFPFEGKRPNELMMPRHFLKPTAACEVLVDFLAQRTGQDPS